MLIIKRKREEKINVNSIYLLRNSFNKTIDLCKKRRSWMKFFKNSIRFNKNACGMFYTDVRNTQ